jgi:hypothetical protein
MNAPEFESRLARLARLAPRRLPAAWKADILSAANSRAPQAPPQTVSPCRRRREESSLGRFGFECWAWGAIAAAWLVIFALHATTPALPPPSGPAMSMAEIERHWREVRRYAAMDLLPPEPPAPVRIQIEQEFVLPAHRPRS